jgi:ABC-type multidrug transport system ATPase subunit
LIRRWHGRSASIRRACGSEHPSRVLLPQPELLLLDEPFSNMDRSSAERMLALLTELRAAGRTIVLTTHQRELAEPMADVVLTMQGGALATAETA